MPHHNIPQSPIAPDDVLWIAGQRFSRAAVIAAATAANAKDAERRALRMKSPAPAPSATSAPSPAPAPSPTPEPSPAPAPSATSTPSATSAPSPAPSASPAPARHLYTWRERPLLKVSSQIDQDLISNALYGLGQYGGVYQHGRQPVFVSKDETKIIAFSEEALRLTITNTFWCVEGPPNVNPAERDASAAALAELQNQITQAEERLTRYRQAIASAPDDMERHRREKSADAQTDKLDSLRRREAKQRTKTEEIAKAIAAPLPDDLAELLVPAPRELARMIVKLGDYPKELLPELVGIRHAPFFRADGTLCFRPGFDPASGVYLSQDAATFGNFDRVFTREDAVAAAAKILHVFVDVPGGPATRSAFVCVCMTTLARAMFPTAPMFLFQANQSRVGKTNAARACTVIGTGGHAPPMIMYDRTEGELDKQVRTRALGGSPGPIDIDNFEGGRLGSPLIVSLMTTDGDVELRHMGTTTAGVSTSGWTLSVTANNPLVDADLVMKVLPINLDYDEERPDLRTGFVHENPLAYARAHVKELTRAAIIILLAHAQAGYPQEDSYTWGSFEGWVSRPRAAAMFAGLADPCAEREALVGTDTKAGFVRVVGSALLKIDPTGKGLTTGQIAEKALINPSLAEAFEDVRERGVINTRLLGWKFKNTKGHPAGGVRILSKAGANQRLWYAERTTAATTTEQTS